MAINNSSGPLRRIIAVGEIVVEIMADASGDGFREPIPMTGPYPSGAPAIFIDQVAKLGQPCGLISAVGNDDFGTLNVNRLQTDGVDISAIAIVPDRPTGSAFVRYDQGGSRKFVFNITHSAFANIRLDSNARALIASGNHLHVMGSSLATPHLLSIVQEAIQDIKSRGGTVSFDPNVRKEMLGAPMFRSALDNVVRQCDIFLPSGEELYVLTKGENEPDSIKELLELGISEIVLKRGDAGATLYSQTETIHTPSFPVQEVDPTGAGDCFGATYVTCRLRGIPPTESLRYAAASGALAVCARGPMEGTATFVQLDNFIRSQEHAR